MGWTALTRKALDEMISRGLQAMDDVVQEAWEAMRIEPEKWQCSPWGDDGGGFWAVAVRNGKVIWYNDIEEGFNESPFTHPGRISEYACNQTSFENVLLGLPEARDAENWTGKAPADAVPPDLQSGGTIVRRQTTYWEVCATGGTLWRLHFKSKAEARFVESRFSTIALVDTHPILLHHHEPWAQLFFTGTSSKPAVIKDILADRLAAATGGWRTLEEYLNGGVDLRRGYGLLMRAPMSLVNLAATAITEMGLTASILESPGIPMRRRGLIMGRSAIVAEAFRFEDRTAA